MLFALGEDRMLQDFCLFYKMLLKFCFCGMCLCCGLPEPLLPLLTDQLHLLLLLPPRLYSVCQYFKVKSGKIGLSNRQKDRNQDGHVFKVLD